MSNPSVSDGKIHLLYLVKNAPGVSYQALMDKALDSLYLDFFAFSQCYSELVAGNLLDREIKDTGTGEVIGSNETIRITKGGEAILEDVEDTLNLQTLGYLKKAAAELREKVDDINSVKAFMNPTGNGDGSYRVELSSSRGGKAFTCAFIADSEEEAEMICSNWRSRCDELSNGFLDELRKS